MINSIVVKDHFLIENRGLIIFPLLPLPKDHTFKSFSHNIQILLPTGKKSIFKALFAIEHFVKFDHKGESNLLISIQNAEKSDVPIGSTIFFDEYILSKIK
jgi:hypothetical protein